MTRTYLDDIVAWHRQRSQHDARAFDELLIEALGVLDEAFATL